MDFILWTVVGGGFWLASMAFAYGAGTRSGYWRGVARGQHAAGRTHMHVMAHAMYGTPLPALDPDDLDDAKKPGPN